MPEIQNHFEGWAVVELFGHGKAIGFVTTEYFGTAALFRVDVPGREEREYLLDAPTWGIPEGRMSETLLPVGTKVKRQAMPAHSRLLGPGSIFAINPCSETVAMAQLERSEPRPLIVVEMPKNLQIGSTIERAAEESYEEAEQEVEP
jgi:hypothetical protein